MISWPVETRHQHFATNTYHFSHGSPDRTLSTWRSNGHCRNTQRECTPAHTDRPRRGCPAQAEHHQAKQENASPLLRLTRVPPSPHVHTHTAPRWNHAIAGAGAGTEGMMLRAADDRLRRSRGMGWSQSHLHGGMKDDAVRGPIGCD